MRAFFSFSLSLFHLFFYDCSYNFHICYYWYWYCYCRINHYLKLLFQSTFHIRNWLDWAFVDFIITDLKKSKPYLLSGFAIGFDHIDCFLKHTCYVRLSTETGKIGKSQIENFFLEKYFAKMSFLPIIFLHFFLRILIFTVSLFTEIFPGSFTAIDLTLHMKLCSQELQSQAAVRSSIMSWFQFICLFIYLFIYIYLSIFIYLFIYLFTYLFIYLFIYSFKISSNMK